MAKDDVYGEPIIMKFPGLTATVYRPILTEEERNRRMKIIHDAAARLLMCAERKKYETREKNN